MENNQPIIGTVILAAGMGKRMQSTMLKVMHPLHERPLIDYVVGAVEKAGVQNKPIVVVCPDDPSVQNFLLERAEYVVQKERLGTGHAVSVTEGVLKGKTDHVIVLYGDMPFIKPESIKKLLDKHMTRGNTLTLMTVIVPDFEGKRAPFYSFGRIIRGSDGNIIDSIEKKDCTSEQLNVLEVNPCIYCFKNDWLWNNLKKINNKNAQQEFYLTDLIKLAIDQGEKISSIAVEPEEAIGINTKEDLESAHTI